MTGDMRAHPRTHARAKREGAGLQLHTLRRRQRVSRAPARRCRLSRCACSRALAAAHGSTVETTAASPRAGRGPTQHAARRDALLTRSRHAPSSDSAASSSDLLSWPLLPRATALSSSSSRCRFLVAAGICQAGNDAASSREPRVGLLVSVHGEYLKQVILLKRTFGLLSVFIP